MYDVTLSVRAIISINICDWNPSIYPFSRVFTKTSTALNIYSICHIDSSKWGIQKSTLLCSPSEVERYKNEIASNENKKKGRKPQALLIFINPYGGRRRAERIYNEYVAPIFALAGISTTVIVTNRKGHCMEYLLKEDISSFDGLVAVGGDGFFSELLHGILLRCRQDASLPLHIHHTPGSPEISPNMRLGLIPAGSTNTVVTSIHGSEDIVTAALHIISGDDIGLDVLGVHDGKSGAFLRYTSSLLGYGFHGDLLTPSETLRWMGPDRYNVAGALGVLKLAAYNGRLSFLPDSVACSHPLDSTVCSSSCSVCSLANQNVFADCQTNRDDQSAVTEQFYFGDDKDEETEFVNSSIWDAEINDNRLLTMFPWLSRSKSAPGYETTLCEWSSPPTLRKGWKSVSGSFVAINGFLISCRCAKSPNGPAPSAHLGDGCIDLIIVRKCSRLEFLRYLFLLANSKLTDKKTVFADHLRLSFVEVHRVKAFEFTPLDEFGDILDGRNMSFNSNESNSASVWCVDGEILHNGHLTCYAHRQLIRFFGRGPAST